MALDVLSGTLVAKGDFDIKLGTIQSAALPHAAQDADVMALTLSGVEIFVGAGGSLATPSVPSRTSTPAAASMSTTLNCTPLRSPARED